MVKKGSTTPSDFNCSMTEFRTTKAPPLPMPVLQEDAEPGQTHSVPGIVQQVNKKNVSNSKSNKIKSTTTSQQYIGILKSDWN